MRLRILPVLIVMAMAMLGLRLTDIWHGFGNLAAAEDKAGHEPDRVRAKSVGDAVTDVQVAQAQEGEGTSGGANAQDDSEGRASETGKEATADRDDKDENADRPVNPLEMSNAEIEVLQQLSERRKALEARETKLDEREQLLQAARKRLEADIQRLEKLKSKIQDLLIDYDEQEEKQVKRLVNIYSNMDAEAAARIFENLKMDVLLKVVDRMNERRTAPILAEMQSEKAKELTQKLAKRKDLPVPQVQN
jgi:flagellar motility protein MotE (MotC chaperone)